MTIPVQHSEYTNEQLSELKKCIEDPVYFIETYVKIWHQSYGAIPFKLYDYQKQLVRGYQNNALNIVSSAREMGKTTVTAAFILWYTTFNFNKRVLIATHKLAQSVHVLNIIKFAHEMLPSWLKSPTECLQQRKLGFWNGSDILAQVVSEDMKSGVAVSLLFCDELAVAKINNQQLYWISVLPAIVTGGACIITSTPRQRGDMFDTLWQSAVHGVCQFVPHLITWDQHPLKDEAFKKQMIGAIGEKNWMLEHECKFPSEQIVETK